MPSEDTLSRLEAFCGRLLDSGYFTDKFVGRDGDRQKAIARMVTVISFGLELGLSPMVSLVDLYVVKGPAMLTRRKVALVHRNAPGAVRIICLESDDFHARYRVERWDVPNPPAFVEKEFSVEDAKRQGLMSNPRWQTDPRRQCCWRCISWALDELCPDLLGNVVVHTFEDLNLRLDENDRPVLNEDAEPIIEGEIEGVEEVPECLPPQASEAPASEEYRAGFRKAMRDYCERTGISAAQHNRWLKAALAALGTDTLTTLTETQLDLLYTQFVEAHPA